MSEPVTHLCPGLIVIVLTTALSLSVSADDRDVRIGRYQTVAINAPLAEIAAMPRLQPTVLPDAITTRGEALQWLLKEHGYALHENAEGLFHLATSLSAPLSATDQRRLSGSLRIAARELLGPGVDIFIDPGSKRVVLIIGDQTQRPLSEHEDAE